MQLAQGKYAEARLAAGRTKRDLSADSALAARPCRLPHLHRGGHRAGFKGVGGAFFRGPNGQLPYASWSDQMEAPPPDPTISLPTNRAELGYYKLKLGNAALEWADALYRSNQPESIMRAASCTRRYCISTERIRRSRRPGIGAA
jgi:hypothetical protein